MGDHDNSYKLLFSHAEMVRDLLIELQSSIDRYMPRKLGISVPSVSDSVARGQRIAAERRLFLIQTKKSHSVPLALDLRN